MAQPTVAIEWLCSRPSAARFPGRTAAIEKVCEDAALLNGWAIVGIRSIDHNTTYTQSRRSGKGRMVKTDPHITVFVGDQSPISKTNCTGHGHFYIIYRTGAVKVPERLAHARELQLVQTPKNPEIWDKNNVPVNTVGP